MNIDGVISWLNNETMRNQHYHNHKENMAWVATVIYLTGMVTSGFTLRSHPDTFCKPLAIVLFLLVTIGAGIFVNWQFSNRWIAAQKVEGLIRTTSRLLSQPASNALDWTIDAHWILPKFVLDSVPPQGNLMGARFASEFISYAIMLIAAVVFISLVCY